jgi:dTDP-4-dehydrorhamnose reductase
MNILITGSSGLVGSHLVEYFKEKNITDTLLLPSSQELDITSSDAVNTYFDIHKPNMVIHYAAYTDVNAAETQKGDEKGAAWKINVSGTENLVHACKKHNAHLTHISTDMVFSGKKEDPGPYKEDHPIEINSSNLTWYGYTKAQAELKTKEYNNVTIIRISYPTRAHYDLKPDHVHKILNAYDAAKPLKLFNDHFLTLTYVNNVSEIINKLIESYKLQVTSYEFRSNIFHISSKNIYTPYDLANYLLEKTRRVTGVVQPSSLTEFLKDNPGRYAQYAGLDITFPTWQEIIDKEIEEGMT